MSLIARKIAAFAKTVSQLADRPGGTVPTAQLKAQFDSSPEELRVAHNGLVDDLASVTPGSSGAEQIGSAPITGLAGDTPYEQITDLLAQVITKTNSIAYTPTSIYHPSTKKYVDDTTAGVVLGQVPDLSLVTSKYADGSVTTNKLASDVRVKQLYKVVW